MIFHKANSLVVVFTEIIINLGGGEEKNTMNDQNYQFFYETKFANISDKVPQLITDLFY